MSKIYRQIRKEELRFIEEPAQEDHRLNYRNTQAKKAAKFAANCKIVIIFLLF